jgi:glycosyltransferase involved in cell wall biosynthesis
MKLAIDCRFVGKSGIGTYIENVVDELVRNHPEHDYLLVAERKFPQYNGLKNIAYLITPIVPFSLKEFIGFPVYEINRCDAFFTPYINIPERIKIPIYSTIHDVIFLDIPSLSSWLGRLIRKGFYLRSILKSKVVFTVSEFSKSRIEYHFGSKRTIKVTYSAISSYIKNYKNKIIAKGDYYIYVGNIKKHKGLLVLLKAFSAAKQEGLSSQLFIVGEHNKFRTSEAEINQFIDSSEDVKFTGFVDNDKLMELIAGAKALILPSYYEGLGLPPMEALYLGTEVIISDIPVFKEIYGDLPVMYFRKGDSVELKDRMLNFKIRPFDVDKVRDYVNSKYNFGIIASEILNTIEHDYTK